MARGHKRVTVNETVVVSILTRENEMFYIFNFSLCALLIRQNAAESEKLRVYERNVF